MRRWSARRAQVSPVAALLAVVVACAGLSLYVGGLDRVLPGSDERRVERRAADDVERTISVGSVVRPSRLSSGLDAVPDGYHGNVTLAVGDERWTAGKARPDTADALARPVSVRRGPGRIRTGTLRVAVWQ